MKNISRKKLSSIARMPMRLALIILFMSALAPSAAFADTVGFFSKIEGRVDMLKLGSAQAVPVNLNDPVSIGDIVRTKSDGKAEITFKDETTVRVAPESRLKIDEYTFNPDNSRNKGILNLFRGKVRAAVSKAKEFIPVGATVSSFDVHTPTAIAGVRGTDLFVFHDRGISGVVFKDGHGFVYNKNMPDKIVNVGAGQATFVINPGVPPLPARKATNVELAQHIKDTAPSEKQKEEKKEEKDKPATEAKAGGKTVEASAKADEKEQSAVVDVVSDAASTETLSGGISTDIIGGISGIGGIATIDTALYTETSSLLPITETNTEIITEITTGAAGILLTAPTSAQFSGIIGGSMGDPAWAGDFAHWDYSTYAMDWHDSISGSFAGAGDLWTGSQAFSASGTYDNPLSMTLWGTYISGTTLDGSAFYGDMHGISLSNYLEGAALAIYIKPDGTTGYLISSGPLTGNYNSDGTWSSSGTLTAYPMGFTSISPSMLYYGSPYLDSGEGSGIINGGGITGSVYMTDASLIGQNWGVWGWQMGGTYSTLPSSNWSASAGGAGYNDYGYTDGYWLASILGLGWSDSKLLGYVKGTYLDTESIGKFSGNILGAYESGGNWQALSSGIYIELPLAFGSAAGVLENNGFQYWDSSLGLTSDSFASNMTGLIGGLNNLWTGSTLFIMMGEYSNPNNRTLWTMDMVSSDPLYFNSASACSFNIACQDLSTTGSSFSGTGYYGLMGGVNVNNALEGGGVAIYIKPDGTTGYILTQNITGSFYPQISMWDARGVVTTVPMGTTSILPSQIYDGSSYLYQDDSSLGAAVTGDIAGTGSSEAVYLTDQNWGIWRGSAGGSYSTTPSSNWTADISSTYPSGSYSGDIITGTQWSGNVFKGSTIGYYADASETWVSVGNIIGTYDSTAMTWQGISMGTALETSTFLSMTQTASGQTSLTALNIPFVEVGRADLTGYNFGLNVNMNDVTFFAYSSGAASKIWATNNVNGSYASTPYTGLTVPLSGNGLNANFNVQSWSNSNWNASVNGSGIYNGTGTMNNGSSIQFKGAAAGTYTGTTSGSFSGTGAGVVK